MARKEIKRAQEVERWYHSIIWIRFFQDINFSLSYLIIIIY